MSILTKNIVLMVLLVSPVFSVEKVLESATFSFPNTLPGKEFKVQKVWDNTSHKIKYKSNDSGIDVKTIEKMHRNELDYLKSKYGKIKGELRAEFESLFDNDSIDVIVIAKTPAITYLDKSKHTKEELKAHSITSAKVKCSKTVRSVLKEAELNLSSIQFEADDKMILKIKKIDIDKIKFNPDISAIEKYREPELCALAAPLSSVASSAYGYGPMPSGYNGSGVKSATYESGIWQHSYRAELDPPDYVDHFSARGNLNINNIYTNDNAQEHSQVTFSCLWYTAPQATIYHKSGSNYGYTLQSTGATEIINNSLQTLSSSYVNYGDQNSSDMLLIDEFAYNWPFPVFCNPAANTTSGTLIVNWHCYNALSVGSFQHANLNSYAWASHSLWTNPDPVYGSSADREMPHVLATGIWPYTVSNTPWDNDCKNGTIFRDVGWGYESALKTSYCTAWQGTSLAAPTANGIASCLLSGNPSAFETWPEKVRTAIILTAANCDGNEWSIMEDGKDGTGALSGRAAAFFAQNHTAVSPSNYPAVQDGLGSGTWYSSQTGPKTFNIRIPSSKPVNKHLRVVLTWNSSPELSEGINYLSDLDLSVYDPNTGVVLVCGSWNSNVEVVDISAGQLIEGSQIQATINPYALRFSTDPSNLNPKRFFYYSIGWTWVANSAN